MEGFFLEECLHFSLFLFGLSCLLVLDINILIIDHIMVFFILKKANNLINLIVGLKQDD